MKETSRSLMAKGGMSNVSDRSLCSVDGMTLLETLALLTFMLGLLSLIVDVVRLTLEVMDKFSQKKNDDSKKD